MVEIRDEKDLQSWLDAKTLEEALCVNSRATLRLLIIVGTNLASFPKIRNWRNEVFLPLIRSVIEEGFYRKSDYVISFFGYHLSAFEKIRISSTEKIELNVEPLVVGGNVVYFTASKPAISHELTLRDKGAPSFYFADLAAWSSEICRVFSPQLEPIFWHFLSLDATALEAGVDLWTQPLWLDDTPEWAERGWENLATELTKRTPYWKTLVRWYEDRLKGDDWAASQGRPAIPELEIARASLPDSYWKKGGKAVNLAIAELEDFFWNNVPLKDPALRELVNGIGVITDNEDVAPEAEDGILPPMPDLPPPELPAQSHGAHFGIRDGLITFALAEHLDPARNNIQRLKSLHPLLLAEVRSAISVFGRNQAHGRIHDALLTYAHWLDGEVTALDFDVLCGLGTKLQSEEAAAKAAISDGLEPPFERSEIAALTALLDLHGPFVLATEIGQQFVADAERWQRNPQEEAAFRQTATDFAEAVETAGIATPETAAFVKQAAASVGTGPQPERSAMFGIGTVRNVGIAIVAAGGIYKAGAAIFSTTIGAWVAAVIIGEGIKKSDIGQGASGVFTDLLNDVTRGTALKRFYDFALRNEDKLRALAGNRREFAFLHAWIDWLKSRGEPK